MSIPKPYALLVGAALLAVTTTAVAAAEKAMDPGVFATVDRTVIPAADFDQAYAMAVRRKYYHGHPPEAELEAMRREVAQSLVDRVLLLAEAKRRNVQGDREAVKKALAELETRYQDSPQWKKERKKVLPQITKQLEQNAQLMALEQQVRTAPEATPAQAQAFYDAHKNLFVEPEQLHLALILLKVDPSAPRTAWDQAMEEGTRIATKLRNGADFGELAKLHSSDASAQRGGDLGYIHRGMLPEAAQQVVDKLETGKISDPLKVLEGVAVVRILDRKPSKQRSFAEVQPRAAELARREQTDAQWQRLLAQLRSHASVVINTTRYPALDQVAAHERPAGTP
jgi:parvulin-like peptidyl-prolyl isomerase